MITLLFVALLAAVLAVGATVLLSFERPRRDLLDETLRALADHGRARSGARAGQPPHRRGPHLLAASRSPGVREPAPRAPGHQ